MYNMNVEQLIEKWDEKGFKVGEISDQLVREDRSGCRFGRPRPG